MCTLQIWNYIFSSYIILKRNSFYAESLIICDVFRYAFEGTLQAIYGMDREPFACAEEEGDKPCMYHDGDSVLNSLDVDGAEFYIDFLMLCTFFVLLRIACYIVLRWRIRRS